MVRIETNIVGYILVGYCPQVQVEYTECSADTMHAQSQL
jgi:hypothetical protein